MRLPFEKWEGLGNDFLLVHARDWPSERGAELARVLCDRRRGVGGDGVLVVDAATSEMIVLNADGSRPEMCGNGARCAAAMLAGPRSAAMTLRTDAGERGAKVTWTGSAEATVEVEMGRAELGAPLEVEHEGRTVRFTTVSVGNPHAVTFEPLEGRDRDVLGPRIERVLPGGTNVEFADVGQRGLSLVVWERGVGYTQACGTGACATAVVACRRGDAPYGQPVEVSLPGGALMVTVSESHDLLMTGPARRVFVGSVEI